MYNSQRFEEVAFEIYIQGMRDYECILEQLIMQKYDDFEDIQKSLDDAQRIFEDNAGINTESKINNDEIMDDMEHLLSCVLPFKYADHWNSENSKGIELLMNELKER